MKRATDPNGKIIRRVRKMHNKKTEALPCNGEAEAWPAGFLVVCVLNYKQLSGSPCWPERI